MNSRTIGRLISVGPKGVVSEILDGLGSHVTTRDGVRFIGEVGSYVCIHELGRTVIGEITGAGEDPDWEVRNHDDTKARKPVGKRRVYISLIGEIKSGKFSFGVSKMPLLYAEVDIISSDDLALIFNGTDYLEITDGNMTKLKRLGIGRSVVFPEYEVTVDINNFFGHHFAVFGNTGAGKSNTLAVILQKIFKKQNYAAKGAAFVIFDTNGEYENVVRTISMVNSDIHTRSVCATDEMVDNRLEIPVWSLTVEDWAILLHASEKTQLPILRRAIWIAKAFYSSDQDLDSKGQINILKNHILATVLLGVVNSSDTSPSKADKLMAVLETFHTDEISSTTFVKESQKTIGELIKVNYGQMSGLKDLIKYLSSFRDLDISSIHDYLRNQTCLYDFDVFSKAVELATLYEGSIGSSRIQEYTSTLLTRIQALEESATGNIFTKTSFESTDAYIENMLGKDNQIIRIDISQMDDASAEVIVKVLSKLMLDYLRKQDRKAQKPINLIVEEAHRFMMGQMAYGVLGYNIFERIAKEGRKYGLLLGISSQRPSELSKTVVSQCSNFIVHRIQNPDDLMYLSHMVPYITQGIINQLTYLQTGTALVFGTAINLPVLTKFEGANPGTDSSSADISEIWYHD